MTNEYCIQTGQLAKISTGFMSSIDLMYSGMPSEFTFAVSPVVSEAFLNDGFKFAPTVYFPVTRQSINLLGNSFQVLHVTPDEIILQYLK